MFRSRPASPTTPKSRRIFQDHVRLPRDDRRKVGCGVDLLQGRDGPLEAPTAADSAPSEDDAGRERRRARRMLGARGVPFRRRHRLHGPVPLYGGRIDAGKGCEELLEYFTSYKERGGDATLVLMGVKLMQMPEVPWVKFAGLLSERERLRRSKRRPSWSCPRRSRACRCSRSRPWPWDAGAVQRPQRRARRSLPARATPGLYNRSRRVRRGAKLLLADERPAPQMGRNGKNTSSRTTAGTSSWRSTKADRRRSRAHGGGACGVDAFPLELEDRLISGDRVLWWGRPLRLGIGGRAIWRSSQ